MEDFATVLENFEAEAEAAASTSHENRVTKGTVIKITEKSVVVDIGQKSEGVVPLAEVTDHEGKVRYNVGDEIPVMILGGESEEGGIRLSHEKAQRFGAWDEIEKAYNEKSAIKGRVVERV